MSSELAQKFLNEDYWDEEYPDEDYLNLDLPIPDWHMAILDERMARYELEDKTKWRTWDEVEKELLEELSKSLTTKALTD